MPEHKISDTLTLHDEPSNPAKGIAVMRLIGTTLLALFMMGNAVAANCPSTKDIVEASTATTDDHNFSGYAYTAGPGWNGFVPNEDEKGTKGIQKVSNLILAPTTDENPNPKVVNGSTICQYVEVVGGLNLVHKK
ncbi:hypothetical protein JYG34_00170 [Pseudomonas entomophila]|uniref:hypothetical protein n=1 Tax=Pseudomonas entomophila TaxID=312306 RepID=UPI001BCB0646|nr:hypothetical protein [Pseudomonas entomophila]QVM91491.1 hypothetical protein JYG34_00170 [Pseudomonas entomophila]